MNVWLRRDFGPVRTWSVAILLKEGDRFCIAVPTEDGVNELVKGATQAFLDNEVKAGRLRYDQERAGQDPSR